MRHRLLLAAFAVPMLVLASCGDDSDDDASDASTSIAATASDFKFEPDSWTVSAGEEFSVEFTNEGSVEHEWAVLNLGDDIDAEADFAEGKVMFEIEAVPAGESTTQRFTVDEAGAYQVICAVTSHFDAGMEGTLTVE